MAQFKPLSNEELSKVVPILEDVLLKTNESKPLFSSQIVEIMKEELNNQNIKYNFVPSALRRMTNYLRSTGKLPVIAGVKGYFVSYSPDVLWSQIESLESRKMSIGLASEGLSSILMKVRKQSLEE